MFNHVTPGQPIDGNNPLLSADVLNKVQAATKDYLSKKGGHSSKSTQQFDRFYFRNDCDKDLPEFSVVGIEEPVIKPEDDAKEREFKNHFTLIGVLPEEKHLARYGITQTPALDGKIGQVIVDGLTVARVNVTNECHNFAERKIDDTEALESGEEGSALILWKEEGTGVKWALVRIDYSGATLVRFKLTERWEAIDQGGEAIRIDSEENEIGDPFQVKTLPALQRIYGPADIGFKGWAIPVSVCSSGGTTIEYHVVNMQRFAQYITGQANFLQECEKEATVTAYWHGENPQGSSGGGWIVKARVENEIFPCECLGDETFHAVFDETASYGGELIYKVFSLKPWIGVVQGLPCSDACLPGDTTRNLIFDGQSLEVTNPGCISPPCSKIISWKGIETIQGPCTGETPTSGTHMNQLVVQAPLNISVTGLCPATGVLKLEEGLIEGSTGSCITIGVAYEDCKYTISGELDPECIPPAEVDFNNGDCITVTEVVDPETGDKSYTIDNTMTLTAGDGITVTDGELDPCNKTIGIDLTAGTCISIDGATINNTMTLAAGDCIAIAGDGCEKTITNTMSVVGGDGITVSKSGCAYSVSLSGGSADPKTTLSLLCDMDVEISPIEITCVESSGSWSFSVSGGEVTVTKSFTSVTLPSSLIEVSSDCGSSGSTDDTDDDPVYTCDDCGDCGVDETKIMQSSTGDCDCIDDTAALPEGWVECEASDPPIDEGYGIQFNGIDCDAYPPHVSFTFLGMPPGSTEYAIFVNGDKGTFTTIGPSYDHEEIPGQEYWGALDDGFGTPQPGECFEFMVAFNGGETQRFSGCC